MADSGLQPGRGDRGCYCPHETTLRDPAPLVDPLIEENLAARRPTNLVRGLLLHEVKRAGAAYDAEACVAGNGGDGVEDGGGCLEALAAGAAGLGPEI